MVMDPYMLADKRGSAHSSAFEDSPVRTSPTKGKYAPSLPVIDENAKGYDNDGREQIVRIKFNWRTSCIFRSDGHLDFISSNNTVYSTRNLDFE